MSKVKMLDFKLVWRKLIFYHFKNIHFEVLKWKLYLLWLHEYTDISYNISKWHHLFPMNRYPCEYSWWYSRMYMAVLVTCSALVLTFFPIAFYLFVLFPKWWESPAREQKIMTVYDRWSSFYYAMSDLKKLGYSTGF